MEDEDSIQDVIDKLRRLREQLPRYTAFGDDNWAKIDGGIEALEWVLGEVNPPVTDEDLKP